MKCVVDVSNEERVVSAIGEVVSEFGRIDYAVNNAGVSAFGILLN